MHKRNLAHIYKQWSHKKTDELILKIKDWYNEDPDKHKAIILLIISSYIIITYFIPIHVQISILIFFASSAFLVKQKIEKIKKNGLF